MISNPIQWPNGAKCACSLTFDMDADSLVHVDHPNDGNRRVSAISMLRYGPLVGVPRIVDRAGDVRRAGKFAHHMSGRSQLADFSDAGIVGIV